MIQDIFTVPIFYARRIEVSVMKYGVIFDSLNEVYEYYNGNVVKIVNLAQLLFYSDICGIQPDWLGKSAYDGKLIGYYGKERTSDCWNRWKRYENSKDADCKDRLIHHERRDFK